MVLQTFARFSCAGQQVWNGGSRLIMLACHAYTLRFYVMLVRYAYTLMSSPHCLSPILSSHHISTLLFVCALNLLRRQDEISQQSAQYAPECVSVSVL